MRVEQAKTEKPYNDRSNAQTKAQPVAAPGTTPSKAVETPNQGAFSKFLDSARDSDPESAAAREASESDRPEKSAGDKDTKKTVDKPGEGKDDAVEAKEKRQDDQRDFSGRNDGGDPDPAFVPAPIALQDKAADTNTAVPQARAILHVADLERIVSAVRSDSFAGAKTVTIDLKNSVLDGLRIQVTLTEQGNLKAEFLALNEQIKKQLDARKVELQSVLKDRSIKLGELKIAVVNSDLEAVPRST